MHSLDTSDEKEKMRAELRDLWKEIVEGKISRKDTVTVGLRMNTILDDYERKPGGLSDAENNIVSTIDNVIIDLRSALERVQETDTERYFRLRRKQKHPELRWNDPSIDKM